MDETQRSKNIFKRFLSFFDFKDNKQQAQKIPIRERLKTIIDDLRTKNSPDTDFEEIESAVLDHLRGDGYSLVLNDLKISDLGDLLSLVANDRANQFSSDFLSCICLSNNFCLKGLCLSFNRIQTVNLSKLTHLTYLYLYHNNLENLDISDLINLKTLKTSNNKLKSINFPTQNLLEEVDLSHNCFEEFDVSYSPAIKTFKINNNFIKKIKLSNMLSCKFLELSNNKIEDLTILNLPLLENIDLQNNSQLNSLPLTLGVIPNLNLIHIQGTQILPDQRNAILESARLTKTGKNPSTLLQKLTLWKKYSNSNYDLIFLDKLTSREKLIIINWLKRLEESADFNTNREKLCAIVCLILNDFKDTDFQNLALIQMLANLEKCQDRASMALNELYLAWVLCCKAATRPEEEKFDMILRAGKTLALRNAIGEQLKHCPSQEESVEAYLYYEITMATRLNLLTCIKAMSHGEIAQKLNEDALTTYVEEHYLKLAASLPILDTMLKSKDEFTEEVDRISQSATEVLEKLGQAPVKSAYESIDSFNNKLLMWKSDLGDIMKKRDDQILNLKISYLKKATSLKKESTNT